MYMLYLYFQSLSIRCSQLELSEVKNAEAQAEAAAAAPSPSLMET